jgi:hypothetical protein
VKAEAECQHGERMRSLGSEYARIHCVLFSLASFCLRATLDEAWGRAPPHNNCACSRKGIHSKPLPRCWYDENVVGTQASCKALRIWQGKIPITSSTFHNRSNPMVGPHRRTRYLVLTEDLLAPMSQGYWLGRLWRTGLYHRHTES